MQILFARLSSSPLSEELNWIRRKAFVAAPRPHLLSAAVGGDGPLRGSSQRCPVVVEIAGGIHLVLWREKR